MKKKLQFSTKLFAAAFASALLLTSSSLFAQVKIGSNSETIGTNNNLEVEAANGKKTVVTKDLGKLIVDGNAQVKTLPAAALTDQSVAADANGNLTARPNVTVAPLTLLAGRFDDTQVGITGVNAVRTGNVVCLEGNIFAKATLAPNENTNEYRIALIPAGFRPRVPTQLTGGNLGAVHADAWEQYTAVIYTNGAVGFYIVDGEFTINRLVTVNGICYVVD
ncbi:hypothetical protein [Dyadobacter diqingensis]|uniref:hypothetical protein n=1 Tax=Dyadobacter diqingensis TaxID=2938121 RepID=UPI0020C1B81B|nr:hypothetical protein [Dyadobacter diqingensis]